MLLAEPSRMSSPSPNTVFSDRCTSSSQLGALLAPLPLLRTTQLTSVWVLEKASLGGVMLVTTRLGSGGRTLAMRVLSTVRLLNSPPAS